MKKICSALSFFLVFSVYSHAKQEVYKTYTDIGKVEKPTLTISEVISSGKKFHRKMVTLEGYIGELKFKEMANGRKFTLFQFFEDDPEKRISVYARGFIEGIESGTRIRIWGFYSESKRFFLRKHKNIMKAHKIQILSDK